MLNNNHLFSFTIPMVLFPLMPITTSLKLNFNNNDKYKTPQGLTPQGIISFIKLLIYLVKKCVENKPVSYTHLAHHFSVGTDNTFIPYLIVFVNTYGKIFKCIIHHVLQLPANNIYIYMLPH